MRVNPGNMIDARLWPAFETWADENGVGNDPGDWWPWWACWCASALAVGVQ